MNIIKLPGLIDPHVHFRTPGQKEKEDFKTGTAAALAGGYTMIIDMPNNKIPITTDKLLDEKMDIAVDNILCDVGFHFGSLGDNFDEFEKMIGKVFGLKLYLNETTGNFLIDKKTLNSIFEAWPKDAGPILVHAEDDAVDAVIKNAKKYKKRTHFCHISLKSDLEKIMKAKKEGIKITCGVTPHHLFLTQNDVLKLGPFARMKPFLKSQKDVDYLWVNLSSIDVIESDHAPHTKKEKKSKTPPYGVPGLETTLPLLLNAVNEGRIEIEDVERLCYKNPKKIFNLPDQEATVTIDMDEEYEIKDRNLYTKCGWSQFNGWKLKGKIKKVTLRKKVVYENGKVLAKKGSGELITPIKL